MHPSQNLSSLRKMTGSPSCYSPRILSIRIFSVSRAHARKDNSDNLCCQYRLVCSFIWNDAEAFCIHFGIQESSSRCHASGSVNRELLLNSEKCNRSPTGVPGFSRLGSVRGLELQLDIRCLAWIFLTFDIGLRLFMSCAQR